MERESGKKERGEKKREGDCLTSAACDPSNKGKTQEFIIAEHSDCANQHYVKSPVGGRRRKRCKRKNK